MGLIDAVTPSAELKVRLNSKTFYVAPGSFSSSFTDESDTTYRKLLPPTGLQDGCEPNIPVLPKNAQFYLLVERGNCSFESKAVAAENVGAKGVVIYNSLEGIYQGNEVASDMDYECENGYGYVNETISPVYGDEMLARIPDSCTQSEKCASGKCVVTNITDENGIKVCCAWDLYITMGASSDITSAVNIPAVFMTMSDADTVFGYPELLKSIMDVTLSTRSTSSIDFASIFIWLIAVCTVAYGAARAAEEDRLQVHVSQKDIRDGESDAESGADSRSSSFSVHTNIRQLAAASSSSGQLHAHSLPSASPLDLVAARSHASGLNPSSSSGRGLSSSASDCSASVDGDTKSQMGDSGDTALDITFCQAVGFVFVSSGFLLLLYFVDIYAMVGIMYLVAAAVASGLVYFYPFFSCVMGRWKAVQSG